jgi:hypothetical protein
MYSKCIFGQTPRQIQRNLINPLGDIPFQNNEYQFSIEYLNKLQNNYTNHLACKSYMQIENDLLEYSDLYTNISKIELNNKNQNMKLLLKISLQGLTGAINSFHLNKKNIELNLENLMLKNKMETIITNKNNRSVSKMESNMSIVKKFTLAPLYSYYIVLFGIPDNGFEQDKLSQIISFMQKYNIDF